MASVATGCGFWLLVVVFVLVAVEASVIAVGVEVTFDFSSAIVLVGVVDSTFVEVELGVVTMSYA